MLSAENNTIQMVSMMWVRVHDWHTGVAPGLSSTYPLLYWHRYHKLGLCWHPGHRMDLCPHWSLLCGEAPSCRVICGQNGAAKKLFHQLAYLNLGNAQIKSSITGDVLQLMMWAHWKTVSRLQCVI